MKTLSPFLKPALLTPTILLSHLAVCGAEVRLDSISADSPSVQTESDSIVIHRLQDFVVEAQGVTATEGGLNIIPSKSDKKYAYDAASLIDMMNLPFKNGTR